MMTKTKSIVNWLGVIFAILTVLLGLTILYPAKSAYADDNAISVGDLALITDPDSGMIFYVGNEDDSVIGEGKISISELVKIIREKTPKSNVYVCYNTETEVNDSTKQEVKNQFDYYEGQEITVLEDEKSSETKVIITRPDYLENKMQYIVYSFDMIRWNHEIKESDNIVASFNYRDFEYIIFVNDGQFCLTKHWTPFNIEVYEIYDCMNTEKNDENIVALKEAFNGKYNIELIKEINFYPIIHVYASSDEKVMEFIMPYYNEKQPTEKSEIIGSADVRDDTITIYLEDGTINIDSAIHASWVDSGYRN